MAKLREYVDETIKKVFSEIGVGFDEPVFEHVYRIVIWQIFDRRVKDRSYVPSEKDIRSIISSVLSDVVKFYSNRREYASELARIEYRKTYGIAYGSYNFKIVEDEKYYKIHLYTSLCEDPDLFPHCVYYVPKVDEEELKKIREFLNF